MTDATGIPVDLSTAAEAADCFAQGVRLFQRNRHEEAKQAFDRCVMLNPLCSEARFFGGMLHLAMGEFSEGWAGYEYRYDSSGNEGRRHEQLPLLRSLGAAAGKTVLVWAEQGLGDTLQFSRYIPLLRGAGANILFEVQSPLKGLLDTCLDAYVFSRGEPFRHVDFQIPLLSLPFLYQSTLTTIPSQTFVLKASQDKISRMRRLLTLPSDGKRCIGIACSGNARHPNDTDRSMPLAMIEPLLARAHVVLIRKELRAADRDWLALHPDVLDCGEWIGDMEDTAAIIDNVDLVISVDTAVAHLAGCMGKSVLILLPWCADWRWLLGRNDTPWYPDARLFRQATPSDWAAVIGEVTGYLSDQLFNKTI
jgi:hypothetical protein